MLQSACLVFTQSRFITMCSSLLHANGSGVRLYHGRDLKLLILVGLGGASCLLLGLTGFNLCFFLFLQTVLVMLFGFPGIFNRRTPNCILSPRFRFTMVFT